MKNTFNLLKILLILILFNIQTSFKDKDINCGEYHGHQLYKGPKGGCYYYNKNGNKTYVEREFCKC